MSFSFWWYLGLFFLPDIGMLGYLWNNKIGAILYNLFHHQAVAIVLIFAGNYFQLEILNLIGIVFLGHSAFDRMFGYGLKYFTGFKFTHLGEIGK